MITWTTPIVPILIKGGNILADNVRVLITVTQGNNSVTLEPISLTSQEDGVLAEINFSQIQSGSFEAGTAFVQTNVIDSSGFRAASFFDYVNLGSNLEGRVISYDG